MTWLEYADTCLAKLDDGQFVPELYEEAGGIYDVVKKITEMFNMIIQKMKSMLSELKETIVAAKAKATFKKKVNKLKQSIKDGTAPKYIQTQNLPAAIEGFDKLIKKMNKMCSSIMKMKAKTNQDLMQIDREIQKLDNYYDEQVRYIEEVLTEEHKVRTSDLAEELDMWCTDRISLFDTYIDTIHNAEAAKRRMEIELRKHRNQQQSLVTGWKKKQGFLSKLIAKINRMFARLVSRIAFLIG